jgi:hypothetical protein
MFPWSSTCTVGLQHVGSSAQDAGLFEEESDAPVAPSAQQPANVSVLVAVVDVEDATRSVGFGHLAEGADAALGGEHGVVLLARDLVTTDSLATAVVLVTLAVEQVVLALGVPGIPVLLGPFPPLYGVLLLVPLLPPLTAADAARVLPSPIGVVVELGLGSGFPTLGADVPVVVD